MLTDDTSVRALVSQFSGDVLGLADLMIKVKEPSLKLTKIRKPGSSALGALDKLPIELVHAILLDLDLRSLSRLTQVCSRGQGLVLSLPAYRVLLTHVPADISVLSCTGYITYCSLASIYATLCSDRCVSCNSFGAFLFAPTCERCCHECLIRNPELWLIHQDLARECFGFSPEQIQQLLATHYRPYKDHDLAIDLVSVRFAKALALKVYGMDVRYPHWESPLYLSPQFKGTRQDQDYLRWTHGASVQVDSIGLNACEEDHETVSNEHFNGLAAILFPVLLDGHRDSGTLCLGCAWASDRKFFMWESEMQDLLGCEIYSGKHQNIYLALLKHRAWSQAEFPLHIKTCRGIRQLLVDKREMRRELKRTQRNNSTNLSALTHRRPHDREMHTLAGYSSAA